MTLSTFRSRWHDGDTHLLQVDFGEDVTHVGIGLDMARAGVTMQALPEYLESLFYV